MHDPGWPGGSLLSPISGHGLAAGGPDVLVAPGEAWPVVDGIAFLRADRRAMAEQAVALLRAGARVEAAALLLTDQDGFAPDPPPSLEATAALVRERERYSFRAAMRALAFGRVGDYFAHRWTDPTYFSGLALAEAAFAGLAGRPVLELACGAGHFLRAFASAGLTACGGDLVFAKLWLARHYVAPSARLVCFDASAPVWPLAAGSVGGVFCHDAFYFLADKPGIVARMRAAVDAGGRIAIGHAHNADADNHSAGAPLDVASYAALLPGASLFDDRELSAAFVEARPPRSAAERALAGAPAVAMLWPAAGCEAAPIGLGMPAPTSPLRLNPLYRREADDAAVIAWPSERYEQEYAALVTYPRRWDGPDERAADGAAALVRRGIYVDLPSQW